MLLLSSQTPTQERESSSSSSEENSSSTAAAVPVLLYHSLETKSPTMTTKTSAIVDEHLMIIRTVSCTSRIEQTCCRERVTVARVTTMSGSSQRGCLTNKRLLAHPTGRRDIQQHRATAAAAGSQTPTPSCASWIPLQSKSIKVPPTTRDCQ